MPHCELKWEMLVKMFAYQPVMCAIYKPYERSTGK